MGGVNKKKAGKSKGGKGGEKPKRSTPPHKEVRCRLWPLSSQSHVEGTTAHVRTVGGCRQCSCSTLPEYVPALAATLVQFCLVACTIHGVYTLH
jgi:hypothetical protein